jgi:hypothetical protein
MTDRKWKFKHGVWLAGPFSIRMETCPRFKLTYFELFDSTRFVRSFASLQDAQQHAEAMQNVSMRRAS